ncbi:hypothetical protein EES46_23000 [Streptomyces sp. ADI98-10]|nr:hypothetical protein EES46_23000 [Streptomyces sp. ADI98-10]
MARQRGQAGVRDDDALGPAGRPGGVDDVRRVRPPQGREAVPVVQIVAVGVAARRWVADGSGRLVQVQARHRGGERDVVGGAGRQQQQRCGVVEHGGDPGPRVVEVDRETRRARLHHRHRGCQGGAAARQGDRHQPLGAGTVSDQHPCQAVGAGVEHRVVEGLGRGEHRAGVRGPPDLLLEHLGEGTRDDGVRVLRGVARGECPRAFRRGQDLHPGERHIGGGAEEAGQEVREPVLVRAEFGEAVPVGVGLELDAHAPAARIGVAGDVEVGDRSAGQRHHLGLATGERGLGPRRHDVHEHAEQLLVGTEHAQVTP